MRCYEPEDAPLLKNAVDASLQHLLPWMPWARFEPQSLDEKLELCRSFRGQFDLDQNYVYGIFTPDETEQLGGSGFHKRSNEGSLEIGYWVASGAIGRGIATEVTAVQTRIGLELCGLDRIDIQVEPRNVRSLAIPRKLGFTEEGTLRRRLPPGGDDEPHRDAVVFSMLREELEGSPCMRYEYAAYDVLGEPVSR
ncbi:MAG: GNAT family N-acetyltransferase [Thermoleophilia bacterium]|nr:GNAT family N-acetyltransferase [Thermoleophilia bacterium]